MITQRVIDAFGAGSDGSRSLFAMSFYIVQVASLQLTQGSGRVRIEGV